MIEKIVKRVKSLRKDNEDAECGAIAFYRFLFVFLLTREDDPADLSAPCRLASLRQEIEENLPKSEDGSTLNRGFREELDFFFQWAEDVRKN